MTGSVAKFSLLAAVLLAAACREMPHPFEYERVLAQVGSQKLRAGDAVSVTAGSSGEDSVALLELYVDKWVRRELKLRAARTLLQESEADIEAQVAEYRNSLITRRLDQYHVDMELDTLFTEEQISTYYNQHIRDFALDRTVVKGRLVRVPASFRQRSRLRELMRGPGAERLQDWRDICRKNDFAMQEFDAWTDFSDFLSYLPTRRDKDYGGLLREGVVQEMQDADGYYYFLLTAVRRAGEAAPLERVRETIRRILFNQRQSEIIRSYEERLYQAALNEGELKINM